jgi:polyphosphate kinase 2 (PPK2 family)
MEAQEGAGMAKDKKVKAASTSAGAAAGDEPMGGPPTGVSTAPGRMQDKRYYEELAKLQLELSKLQEWVKARSLKVVVIFEGRDAAGKGGAIKTITLGLNPRVARIVALPAPTERERTQWYFQRYAAHLPAAGEIVLLDRSWYNRAGVERVMGFATQDEVQEFYRDCPEFERMLVRSGIVLVKYWFSVSRSAGSRAGSRTPPSAGSCHRWTSSRGPAGSSTRWPRTRCSGTRTSSRRRGTWWPATTRSAPAST